MKNLKYIIPMLAMLLLAAIPARADKYSINREDLPKTAQEFLTRHFPKTRVSMVKTDRHLLRPTDYDVKLVNGTTIEFNNKGEWTSVDCKTKAVPTEIVPKAIRTYVEKNFPETFIVEIEKKALNFEVELNDGVELKFDRLGKFKSMSLKD